MLKQEEESIMSNTINFKKMSNNVLLIMNNFRSTRNIVMTLKSEKIKALKILNKELKKIQDARQQELKKGIKAMDVIFSEYSTVDIENKIAKTKTDFDKKIAPYQEELEECYKLIPEEMYIAYNKKIESLGSNTTPLNAAMKDFFINCGIEDGTEKNQVIAKTANKITSLFGATGAGIKDTLDNNKLVSTLKKDKFNDLFMCAFTALLIKHKIIHAEDEKDDAED